MNRDLGIPTNWMSAEPVSCPHQIKLSEESRKNGIFTTLKFEAIQFEDLFCLSSRNKNNHYLTAANMHFLMPACLARYRALLIPLKHLFTFYQGHSSKSRTEAVIS